MYQEEKTKDENLYTFYHLIGVQVDDISGPESARVVSYEHADEGESNVAAAEDIRQLSADVPCQHRDDRQIVLSDAETFAETLAIGRSSVGYPTRGHSSREFARRDGAAAQASSDYHKSTTTGHPEARAESIAAVAVAITGNRHGKGKRERRVRQTFEHHAIGDIAVANNTGQLR